MRPLFLSYPNLSMQSIEFTYNNDGFSEVAMNRKHAKYDILISHLHRSEWNAKVNGPSWLPSLRQIDSAAQWVSVLKS